MAEFSFPERPSQQAIRETAVGKKVAAFLIKHPSMGEAEVPPASSPVLVACSGGPDSTALALVAWAFTPQIGLAHVNYLQRGAESDGDEAFVQALAEHLGVACYRTNFDPLSHWVDPKGSFQMQARAFRYAWFEKLLQARPYTQIWTGHTRNDQTETLLWNLIRSGDTHLWKGISSRNGAIRRPLLSLPKQDLLGFLKELHYPYRLDASNDNPAYARNRLRNEVLPVLRELNPNLDAQLVDRQEVNEQHIRVSAYYGARHIQHIVWQPPKPVLNGLGLTAQDWLGYRFEDMLSKGSAIPAEEALRLALAQHLEAVYHLPIGLRQEVNALLGKAVGKQIDGKGWRFTRERFGLSQVRLAATSRTYRRIGLHDLMPVPASFRPFASHRLADDYLVLRPWKPGERVHLPAQPGPQLLKSVLDAHNLPTSLRPLVQVLTDRLGPLWVVGVGPTRRTLSGGKAFTERLQQALAAQLGLHPRDVLRYVYPEA